LYINTPNVVVWHRPVSVRHLARQNLGRGDPPLGTILPSMTKSFYDVCRREQYAAIFRKIVSIVFIDAF
jgi:hypothetical protein